MCSQLADFLFEMKEKTGYYMFSLIFDSFRLFVCQPLFVDVGRGIIGSLSHVLYGLETCEWSRFIDYVITNVVAVVEKTEEKRLRGKPHITSRRESTKPDTTAQQRQQQQLLLLLLPCIATSVQLCCCDSARNDSWVPLADLECSDRKVPAVRYSVHAFRCQFNHKKTELDILEFETSHNIAEPIRPIIFISDILMSFFFYFVKLHLIVPLSS